MAGSTKTIQCILTDVANFQSVIVSRHSSEETLCEVDVSGNGTCENNEFSIDGTMHEDIFTAKLTVHTISCGHGGIYSCKAVGINSVKTSIDFQVTGK